MKTLSKKILYQTNYPVHYLIMLRFETGEKSKKIVDLKTRLSLEKEILQVTRDLMNELEVLQAEKKILQLEDELLTAIREKLSL